MEAKARSGLTIRLTGERGAHIIEEHGELAGMRADVLETIRAPTRILTGKRGELLAVRELEPGRSLVVICREEQKDGSVITAFLTSKLQSLERRKQLWPLPS